jgi:hypothetical protein
LAGGALNGQSGFFFTLKGETDCQQMRDDALDASSMTRRGPGGLGANGWLIFLIVVLVSVGGGRWPRCSKWTRGCPGVAMTDGLRGES